MDHASVVGPWRITHGFLRDASLLAVLDALPDGSIDHFASVDVQPPVIVVVEVVPHRRDESPAPIGAFRTDFFTQAGERSVQEWRPAEGKTRRQYLAVFGLSADITGAETHFVNAAAGESAEK
jgi:hypothetical protein